MNRKNLTAAVLAGLAGAAGIAGTAQAVNLNPDGLGQVLIYPYYTTNDGNDTLLSVVNTTDQAKAVKVRFKEGYNSREVLDFNMYMSAYDVWVAAITDSNNVGNTVPGVPTLLIPDTTCTVPYLYGIGAETDYEIGVQEFLPYDYSGPRNDGGPDEEVGSALPRASEGYFEMIEMGTLTDDTATEKRLGSAEAATHVYNEEGPATPADCQQLVDNWTRFGVGDDGMWIDDKTLDIARNSGGLFGGAAIINVQKGTMHAYDAKAVQGFDKSDDGTHEEPGFSFPSLNSGDQYTATIFFGVPQDKAVDFFYERGVDAVSAVFMHEYTMNEYNIQGNLNAGSEWIITFPTKSFYVDDDILGGLEEIWVPNQDDPDCDFWTPGEPFPPRDGPTYNDSTSPPEDGAWELCSYIQSTVDTSRARPPFTELFDGEACENFGLEVWDREESANPDPDRPNTPPVVSPRPPGGTTPPTAPFELCYEVNVLRFGETPVFGTTSDLLYSVSGTPENGWARINWGADPEHKDYAGLVGLPVTGFWALQYSNGFLGTPEASVLSNYGGAFDHKGNVRRTFPDRQSDSGTD